MQVHLLCRNAQVCRYNTKSQQLNYDYTLIGHKKQSLAIVSGIEEEKEKDPIVNEVSKQQVLVQYLKVKYALYW